MKKLATVLRELRGETTTTANLPQFKHQPLRSPRGLCDPDDDDQICKIITRIEQIVNKKIRG